MNVKTKTVATLGIATTLALVLSYVESLFPPLWAAVPAIKMGLPNIVIVFLLYRTSPKWAIAVSLLRVFLVAFLFGSAMTLAYSTAGALLSILTMMGLKHTQHFTPVGVSVAGAVMHNVGQILVAVWLLRTVEIGYYLIVLTITGTLAGILIGLLGSYVIKRTDSGIL